MHRPCSYLTYSFVLLSFGLICNGDLGYQLTASNPVVISDFWGTNYPSEIFDPSLYDAAILSMQDLYITKVRIPIHWAILEPSQNVIDGLLLQRISSFMSKASAANLSIQIFFAGSPTWITSDPNRTRLSDNFPPSSFEPYYTRLIWLADLYHAQGLETFEIWNEVNLMPWPADSYANFLAGAYSAMAAWNANQTVPHNTIKVSMAGMGYYSQMAYYNQVLEFQSLAATTPNGFQNCDIAPYHPYFVMPEGNAIADFVPTTIYLNAALHQFGVQAWANEWGWSTYNTTFEEQPFITELQQADFMVRRFVLSMTVGFDRIYQFALTDFPDGWYEDRDGHYGLLRFNGQKKPSYSAMKLLLNLLGPAVDPVVPFNVTQSQSNLFAITLQRRASVHLPATTFWLGWSYVNIVAPVEPANYTIFIQCKNCTQGIVHILSTGENYTVPVTLGQGLRIDVGPFLQMVELVYTPLATSTSSSTSSTSATPTTSPTATTSSTATSSTLTTSIVTTVAGTTSTQHISKGIQLVPLHVTLLACAAVKLLWNLW